MGEVACHPPAGLFSCWGGLTPVPWPVSLSEWPAPWWGSRSEPEDSTQCLLVSKNKKKKGSLHSANNVLVTLS